VVFIVAAFSVIRKTPVTAANLVLSDMSIRRNIKPLRSPGEPLHFIII
jgi:hypothetical protein